MRIQPFTLSVVVGTAACQARCPFCVSRMTCPNGVTTKPEALNWGNWKQTLQLAQQSGVTTVLLTGKGEPTLYPDQITEVLKRLEGRFPIVELQTNGLRIAEGTVDEATLVIWYELGLRVISISNVGPSAELGRAVYVPRRPEYMDLAALTERLHRVGFSVRLATVMIAGGVEDAASMAACVAWAQALGAEQLTVRSVDAPSVLQDTSEARDVRDWVESHRPADVAGAHAWVEAHGTPLLKLPHGATIYDVGGQNVCITNCLTESTDPDAIRQLIYFFSDGHLRYSWQFHGAILL